MKPYILFRRDLDNAEEFEAVKEVFGDRCTRFRSDIPSDVTVICRYSCLPFFRDLEDEIHHLGSELLNSWAQHSYIANMDWYYALEGMTPKTYFNQGYATVPDCEEGWVVKGRTNSRKFKWNTHMRAKNRSELESVCRNLWDDALIADQGQVIREYVPLRQLEEGINGMPVTNEWRCFFIGDTLIASGYYWAQAECAEEMGMIPPEALALATKAASLIKDRVSAGVIDVGEKADGDWIVIEVNDFMMSGLSMIDPSEFYQNLWNYFEEA